MLSAAVRPASTFKPCAARILRTSRRTLAVRAEADGKVNPAIKKDVDKVVDTVNVSTIEKKAVYCRCWRSEKFPLCDGAHVKHNQATGDNVGPLILEKK